MEVAVKTAAVTPAVQQPNATPIYKHIRAESTNVQFLSKLAKSRNLAWNIATTKSAAVKIGESEKAQNTPSAESRALSNQGQVADLQAKNVEPKSVNDAKDTLQQGIRNSIPATLKSMDEFKESGKGKQIGKAVMWKVSSDVGNVKAGFGTISVAKPAAPSNKGMALPAMEQTQQTEEINLGVGVVPAIEKQELDNTPYLKQSDDLLKQEEVSQEQLDMVDKGDLANANKERQNLNKEATMQPAAVQQMAATEHKNLNAEMHAEEKNVKADMQKTRQNHLTETGSKQEQAKIDLEKKREEVAQNINKRYEACQRSITEKLDALEKNSLVQFDNGQAKATKEFEDQVNRDINKFKDRRYDRIGGSLLWLKDKLFGIDDFPEVKQAFETARAAFVTSIDTLIATITKANNDVITGCKKELEDTKTAIAIYVATLGPLLRDVGKKAQEEVGKKLQALGADIDKRKEKLQEKLADKRKAAMEAIDKKIEAMKASMSGALSIIGNLLLKAAMKFFKWALEATGVSPDEIMGIINKGVAVIKAIVTKPIVFVKNLINAAKTGFKNFGTNFLKHLKDAVFNWLTGALEGVTLPKVWDTKGIFSLLLDILGLTYQALRGRMVKLLGEPAVANLEKVFILVKTLVTEGPIAAWEQLKGMAEEIKGTFVDTLKSWIQNTIIYKAIETVISIFIPGAGIIKAIIGIYDTVMFFIQKAKQIAQMVGNFLGSIAEIAMGNIGAAADALEGGLAKALSLVINFLAKFLHLSGITDKIKKVIEMVRGKVSMVLDKIVAWIQKMAGKLLGKKDEKPDERTDEQKMKDLKSGVNEASIIISDKEKNGRIKKFEIKKIKDKYRLVKLDTIIDSHSTPKDKVHIHGEVNPTYDGQGYIVNNFPPEPKVIIQTEIGPSQTRQRLEEVLEPPGKAGLPGFERAHLIGAGFGSETSLGVFYTPLRINQILQNQGIEEFIRQIYAQRSPNARFFLTASAEPHPSTQILARVVYKLSGQLPNEAVTDIFEVRIIIKNTSLTPKTVIQSGDTDEDTFGRYTAFINSRLSSI